MSWENKEPNAKVKEKTISLNSLARLLGFVRVDDSKIANDKIIIVVAHDTDGELHFLRKLGLRSSLFDEIDAYVDIGDPSHDYGDLEDLDDMYGGHDDEEGYESTMRPSLTQVLKGCSFEFETRVTKPPHHEAFIPRADTKSKGRNRDQPSFHGAHDGSNDAFWTLRATIKKTQRKVDETTGPFTKAPDWSKSGQTSIFTPFILIAWDFEGASPPDDDQVRQGGIATLDSDDLIDENNRVLAVDRWREMIKVRTLNHRDMWDKHHPCAIPSAGPLYVEEKDWEIGDSNFMAEQLKNLLQRVKVSPAWSPILSSCQQPPSDGCGS